MADIEQDVTLAERLPLRTYSQREVREIALQAAGAASAIFMQAHPQDVMPSTEVADATEQIIATYGDENPSAFDLCETAWGVIANAYGGNWEDASDEWREAAERWRDLWHGLLDRELHTSHA